MIETTKNKPFYIFVDVDDTFVRNYGSKRIPIMSTIRFLKTIKEQGAILYCWSSGGAEYAKKSADEFGIAKLFTAFIPKPQMILDDQKFIEWRNILQVHPLSCSSKTLEDYRSEFKGK